MVHELAHSWFQHVLATNEGKHAWMDEGFTSYISSWCMNEIMNRNKEQPYLSSYKGYYSLVKSGNEQPLTTHSDRYSFNYTYSIGAYSKGSVFLSQLGYIIGEEALAQTLKKYYSNFKFTHPTPTDIIRTAEKISSVHLGWYLQDWTQTTNTIDYAVEEVSNSGQAIVVTLKRVGLMPMPIDVVVTLKNGDQLNYYIPLTEMRGEKKSDQVILLEDWSWAKPSYSFSLEGLEIDKIEIDPTGRMADIDKKNNVYQAP
jgi:aminopeptidase N